jgi:hypothetical protein
MWNLKPYLAVIIITYIFCCVNANLKLREENQVLNNNIKALCDTVVHYKVQDSLNAATVIELQLSKNELQKKRNEDKKLIEQLTREAELQSLKKIEAIKCDTIKIELVDTFQNNSIKSFEFYSEWTDVSGIITCDSINLNIVNREALIITESLQKKKLWFIKLPVWLFGYKHKRLDVVSKNPNTEIQSVEYINIR